MFDCKKILFDKSIYRFLFVGGISTAIDFFIYIVIRLFVGTSVGKLLSMLCANLFSYFMNKKWTFSSKQNNSAKLVGIYILSQIVNIGTNVITNTLMFQLTGMVVLSFVIATSVAMIVNFLCQKLYVFKK